MGLQELKNHILSSYLGEEKPVQLMLTALLAGGHVLMEGPPGVGKTLLAMSLGTGMEGHFNRISCTPDLLPSDITGVSVYNDHTRKFTFRPGPVIADTVLVDEITRATPRTQSALLECMAEKQVTAEGKTIPLPETFFLIATQSPTDAEGTFPLPEVQKDRFLLSIQLGYPGEKEEKAIMKGTASSPCTKPLISREQLEREKEKVTKVFLHDRIKKYLLDIVAESRDDERLMTGISPRGSLALCKGAQARAHLQNRDYVIPEDIKALALPVLEKRLIIKREKLFSGLTPEAVINEYLGRVEVPPTLDD